jgi:hypothetical protein
MRQPPDKRNGPGTTPGRSHKNSTTADEAKASVHGRVVNLPLRRPGRPDVCWRCGVPFALTTDAVLRRCAELAAGAS